MVIMTSIDIGAAKGRQTSMVMYLLVDCVSVVTPIGYGELTKMR